MDPKTVDLCKVPAGKSPNGKYNFVDPPSLGPAIIAVGATLLAVSTAFTAVRLFLNRKKLRSADCKCCRAGLDVYRIRARQT